MALSTGFPNCTKWKNYRYPLTRLTDGVHFTSSSTGQFLTTGLDIWINDDWFRFADALTYPCSVTMHQVGSQDDECVSLYRPRVFTDGSAGASTLPQSVRDVEGGDEGWFKLGNSDTAALLNVMSSSANTISSVGNRQSLYTVIPGLHFGFISIEEDVYDDGDYFIWTMNADALSGIPKIMDGTHTCWYQLPTSYGNSVATEPLPNQIGNKSFNVMWNQTRHISKRADVQPNSGQTIYLEGSNDKTNWVTITKLANDIDIIASPMWQVQFDSNAIDGSDLLYKRLRFEYEEDASPSNEMDFQPYQWIQVNITPN